MKFARRSPVSVEQRQAAVGEQQRHLPVAARPRAAAARRHDPPAGEAAGHAPSQFQLARVVAPYRGQVAAHGEQRVGALARQAGNRAVVRGGVEFGRGCGRGCSRGSAADHPADCARGGTCDQIQLTAGGSAGLGLAESHRGAGTRAVDARGGGAGHAGEGVRGGGEVEDVAARVGSAERGLRRGGEGGQEEVVQGGCGCGGREGEYGQLRVCGVWDVGCEVGVICVNRNVNGNKLMEWGVSGYERGRKKKTTQTKMSHQTVRVHNWLIAPDTAATLANWHNCHWVNHDGKKLLSKAISNVWTGYYYLLSFCCKLQFGVY